MIAPNGNGPLQGNGPSVMASSTGQGAVNQSPESTLPAVTWEVVMLHGADDFARHVLPMGATPYDEPLVCPCNSEPWPCVDCKRENAEKDLLSRLRRLREAEDYFVSDGEARDGGPTDAY